MRRIPKKTKIQTAVLSIVIAAAFIATLFYLVPRRAITFSNEIFLIGIVISITPAAILDYLNQRWMEAIEDQMPVFVRGISESQETGMTLIAAVENVIESKMVRHPLSDELQMLTLQMSWGLSFEDTLVNFKERIGSPVVNRFCALVIEASRSGGQIKKVFTATAGFMEEMKQMDRETSSQMKPYLVIIYVAFFVFILTSIILLRSFFVPLAGYTHILNPVNIIGVSEFNDFFYKTMLISGLMGGLMAGKMSERRVQGGLKHAIALTVVGYVIFYFMIPPNWMGG